MRLRSLMMAIVVAVVSIPVTATAASAGSMTEPDSWVLPVAPPDDPDGSYEPAIVDGTLADSSSGMAAVFVNGAFTCSGSIIAPRWVLTAKHCVGANMSVRVKSLNRTTGGGMVTVDYTKVRTNHDIALLHLDRSANAEYVRLASAHPKVGTTNYIFGWGRTCSDCSASTYLRRATVNVTDVSYTDYYGGRAIRSYRINGNACYGDSGGPQFKLVDGLRYQVGVLSTISSGCTGWQNYSSVPTSLTWIKQVAGI